MLDEKVPSVAGHHARLEHTRRAGGVDHAATDRRRAMRIAAGGCES
jgi:hypothetical protein